MVPKSSASPMVSIILILTMMGSLLTECHKRQSTFDVTLQRIIDNWHRTNKMPAVGGTFYRAGRPVIRFGLDLDHVSHRILQRFRTETYGYFSTRLFKPHIIPGRKKSNFEKIIHRKLKIGIANFKNIMINGPSI